MQILKADVEWALSYDNNPRFKVLVDQLPPWEESRFIEAAPHLYYSNNDGFVRFLAGDTKKHGEGYGGRQFNLPMKDSSTVILVGPWSSRSGCFNYKMDVEPCCEVLITDKEEVFEQGYTFYGGVLSVARLQECAKLANVYLAEVIMFEDEHYFVPCLRRTPPKGVATNSSSIKRWRFVYPCKSEWVNVEPLKLDYSR